jgi:signal transduction histidine kinase
LESVYREYEARRDDVLRLYDQGDAAEAKRVLFGDVNDLCQQAFELCDEFIAVNRQHAEARLRDVQAHVTWMSSLVSLSLAFVAGLSAWLLWLFFQDVLRPLRRMLAEARHFSGEPPAAAEPAPDELRAVGEHFRALMSDVADTCSSLQRSRSQLLQAEKLAAVGRLAASVAHEIRNPLTAMKMWLFSIRKAVGPDPELDPSFEIDGA